MAKDSMTPILLLGGAGLAYWGYTQGWFSSLFGASAAPASSGAPSTAPAGGTVGPTATSSQASVPASTPSYSGPSLDQMFQSLQTAVRAAYGSDQALSCAVGSPQSLSGYGAVETNAPRTQTNTAVSRLIAARSIPLTGGVETNAPRGAVSGSCSNPLATYDVFNWYLAKAVPSVTPPGPPDHTTVISLNDYWTWCAPLLKQAMPGLAGGFNSGFGGYAELGMILERQAGGF